MTTIRAHRMRAALVLTVCAVACAPEREAGMTDLSDLGPAGQLSRIAISSVPFGDVVGVVADSSGRIYVADAQARVIVVLAEDGHELHRIGRRGEGPGEFASINSMAWKADTLAVLDTRNRRISLFDASGEPAASIPWPRSAGRPYRLLSAGGALIAAGTFPRSPGTPVATAAEAADRFRQPAIRYFEVLDGTFRVLALRDTLAEPRPFDCDAAGGMIATFGKPLLGRRGPLRGFIAPDTFISAVADSARLEIVDVVTGDTTRSIRLDVQPVPVDDSHWMQWTADYRERERNEGPFSCDLEAMRPATLPPIRSVVVGPTGRLWAEIRVMPDRFAFVMLDADGTPVTVAVAPPRDDGVAPYVRGGRLYVVQRDQFDDPSVVAYQMAEPRG